MTVNHDEITPSERFRLHGADPGEIVAAADEASELVATFLARLRAPWMNAAACRTVDTSVFFKRSPADALQICGRCDVIDDCREFAIGSETIVDGVFAGMTPAALRQARRARSDASAVHTYSAHCACDDCRSHRAERMRTWRRKTGRTGPR